MTKSQLLLNVAHYQSEGAYSIQIMGAIQNSSILMPKNNNNMFGRVHPFFLTCSSKS